MPIEDWESLMRHSSERDSDFFYLASKAEWSSCDGLKIELWVE